MINIGELSSYIDGTFTDCRRNDLNHAVTIVGLTEKQEWIVRNSWGRSWGNYGYFILGHGNTCGICSYAIVPILEMKNGEVIGYGSD
jgi:aminopeptidase C